MTRPARTSVLESLQVWNVRKPAEPRLVGTLPTAMFENEAMNCGERRTRAGTQRFALIGVDLYQDARPRKAGLQAFSSPTAGHTWNFDAAGYGTHTGFDGSAIFDVRKPTRPRLVTTTAGSFQTWGVKRLDGTKDANVPLDKVELADLGTFPSPVGAFCSSHWFDWDAMWVPVHERGRQTAAKTRLVYAIDLVRGLDVYRVALSAAVSQRRRA